MIFRRQLLVDAYKLADLLVMVASFAAVVWLLAYQAHGHGPGELLAVRLKVTNFLLFVGLAVVWHLCLTAFGLYRSRRLSSHRAEAYDVFRATSLGSLLLLAAAIPFDIELITSWRWFFVLFWATATTATVGFRLLLRLALERGRRRGRNLLHVLIIGSNARAREYAEKIAARPELGYRVMGFVDEHWAGMGELLADGGKLVAGFDDLLEYLRENVVDEVVLALPVGSLYPQGRRIVGLCEELGITVRVLSDVFDLKLKRADMEVFQSYPVMALKVGAMNGRPTVVRRMLNFAGALIRRRAGTDLSGARSRSEHRPVPVPRRGARRPVPAAAGQDSGREDARSREGGTGTA